MKNPNRETVERMDALPNIGPAIAADLAGIGFVHPRQLIGVSPLKLYQQLCDKSGAHVDYCVLDVFMSAVDYMEGGEPKPWWSFTPKRKLMLQQ